MLVGGTRLHHLTFDAIESLRTVHTPELMLGQVASVLSQFGFDAFVLSRLPSAESSGGPDILLNGWPGGWSDRYAEAGHFRYDPLSRHCLATTEVFSWDEIPAPLFADPRADHVRREAGEFRLVDGLCVPTRTSLGFGGLSLAGQKIDHAPQVRQAVRLLALQVWDCLEAVGAHSGRAVRLTQREKDVLRWIAQGKTVQDVGSILGISDHTVGEHLKKVRAKLDTTNSAHSVVRALQLGLIAL